MVQELNINTKIWLVISRITLGWLFFYAGITKLIDPNWSAAGFLNNAKTLPTVFAWFAQPNLINQINFVNEWALTLLGLSLIFGLFVKWSTLPGVFLMLLYYLAGNALPSVPNGFLVDEHVIYILFLLLFFVMNAGDYFGLDREIWRKRQA